MDVLEKAKTIAKIVLRFLWLLISMALWILGLYVFLQNILADQALIGWFLWALLCTPTTFFVVLRHVPDYSSNYILGAIGGLLFGIIVGPLYSFGCLSVISRYITYDFNSIKEQGK